MLAAYAVSAVVVTIQRGFFGFPNDFAIFRAAFWNLVSRRDLYVLRMAEAHDYFKYSPTFALLFAPFAVPPFLVGLFLWNAFNAITLFFALKVLLPRREALVAQALAFLPMLRNMQSSQSNSLVAALIIFAFVAYTREWTWRGSVAVAAGTFIKVFPAAAATFALARGRKLHSLVVLAITTTVFALLPVLVVGPTALQSEYASWLALQRRETGLLGSSLMALLHSAGVNIPAWAIQFAGAALVVSILFLRRGSWGDFVFNRQFLALVMIFCVLFNHRAEPQSRVIAVTGMAIWLLVSPRTWWRICLFGAAFAFTSLVGSELTPSFIKGAFGSHLRFAVPLVTVWVAILADIVRPPALLEQQRAEAYQLDATPRDRRFDARG
ncbi:MAG: glycosyltransferase family 87 protein [Gemmatimonadaceae bacterium]